MPRYGLLHGVVVAGMVSIAPALYAADAPGAQVGSLPPVALTLQQEPESVYAPPSMPRPDEGLNEGGVHFGLQVGYFTDYVFRGIEILEPPGEEDSPNIQFDGKLSFDFGRLPHPFIQLFVNLADSDPVSNFQTVQPTFGIDWDLKPVMFSTGYTTYIYPDRDELQTGEFWGKVVLDDSGLWGTEKPVLSPYLFGAYDVDVYDGFYAEAGVEHEFPIEGTGFTLITNGHISYEKDIELFSYNGDNQSGFQHYQLGLIGKYELNNLFNTSERYGKWTISGHLYYTDGINDTIRADTQMWGGVSLGFEY